MKAKRGFHHHLVGSVSRGDPMPEGLSESLQRELAPFFEGADEKVEEKAEEKAAPKPRNKAKQPQEDK